MEQKRLVADYKNMTDTNKTRKTTGRPELAAFPNDRKIACQLSGVFNS